eukprot:PhF_6_TR9986/c0_g1_i3/m.15169
METFGIKKPLCMLSIPHTKKCFIGTEGSGVYDVSSDPARCLLETPHPSGLCFLQPNYIAVADSVRNQVVMCDIQLGSGRGGSVLAGTGSPGFLDGPALHAMFNGPTCLAVLEDRGWILIADTGNHAIRYLTTELDTVHTLVGNACPGYVDGPLRSCRLRKPLSLAQLSSSKILLCDGGNHALRCLDLEKEVVMTVVGGSRTPGFADGATDTALLSHPCAVHVDTKVGILISDKGNKCIRLLRQNKVYTMQGVQTGIVGFGSRNGITVILNHAEDKVSILDLTDELKYVPTRFDVAEFRTRKIVLRGATSSGVGDVQHQQQLISSKQEVA